MKYKIKELIILTAKNRSVIKYRDFYDMFLADEFHDENLTLEERKVAVWDTTESIFAELTANKHIPLYGALFANQKNFPGSGFFDTYKIKRYKEYAGIINGNQTLLDSHRTMITNMERDLVYAHAVNLSISNI